GDGVGDGTVRREEDGDDGLAGPRAGADGLAARLLDDGDGALLLGGVDGRRRRGAEEQGEDGVRHGSTPQGILPNIHTIRRTRRPSVSLAKCPNLSRQRRVEVGRRPSTGLGGFAMSRSPVKAGMHVQRNRASTRGRQDRRRSRAQTPDSLLCSWIYANVPLNTLDAVRAVDCKLFLQNTGNFDLSPCHRLIHRALHVEEEPKLPQPAGWLALRAIYDYALRLNEPDAWRVHRATVSSAAEVLYRNVLAADVRERIARDGISAGHVALE